MKRRLAILLVAFFGSLLGLLVQNAAHAAGGGTITGQVTGQNSQALESTTVSVYEEQTPWNAVATTYTAANGSYTLSGLPAGDYLVRFVAPSQSNYISEWYEDAQSQDDATAVPVQDGGSATVDATLDLGSRIQGTVTAEQGGQAISGAYLYVYSVDDKYSTVAYASTGQNGQFTTDALPTGDYKIQVNAPYQSAYFSEWHHDKNDFASATPITLGPAGTDATIAESLTTGFRVKGTVTAEQGGQPLSGVNVYVYSDNGYSSVASGYSGQDGTYTTSALPPGDYKVRFSAPYQSAYLGEWFDNKQSFDTGTPVGITTADATANASLALGSRIKGTVTAEPGGQPLSGANIYVYSGNQSSAVGYAYTGQDGSFATEGLPPGDYKVRFNAPYQSAYLGEWYDNKQTFESATPVKITTPGTDATANAGLQRGSQVNGTITAAQGGQPLANVSVSIDSEDDSAYSWAYTDANGKYTSGGLPAGDYRVHFSPQGNNYLAEWYDNKSSYQNADPVTLQTGQDKTVNAALDNASHIAGTVTDPLGNPVSAQVRAYVNGDYTTAYTTSNGAYDIGRLRAGSYTLRITPDEPSELAQEWWNNKRDEYDADPIALGTDQTITADVTLDPGAVITGTVRDEQDQTVSGVTVKVTGEESETTVTAPDGTYRLAGLEPGDYRVRFKPLGDLAGQWYDGAETKVDATVLNLASGASKTGVDARLRQARTIGGNVVDPDGKGIADVRVEVYAEGSSYYADRTTTDDQGAFRTHDLPAGSYRVYIRPSSPTNFASQWYDKSATRGNATPVPVAQGQSATITAELEVGGSITGTVTGPGGSALTDAYVAAQRDGDYRYAQTDADGRYTLTGLTTGDYSVEFSADGDAFLTEWYDDKDSPDKANPVAVTIGQTTTNVDAQLARAGSISGTVRTAQGDPISYSEVTLYQGDEQVAWAWVGMDGTYTFRGLKPGKYTMYGSGSGEWLGQWWNNKPDQGSANTIDLQPGQDLTGLDFTLARGGSVSGTVTGQGGALIDGYVELTDAQGDELYGGYIDNGSYSVVGLPSGTYYAYVRTWNPDWLSEWWDDSASLPSAKPITVATGQAVTGINAVLAQASKIRGTIKDGNDKPIRACVTVFRGTTDEEVDSTCSDSDGTYVVGGLRTGQYQVRFDPDSGNFARQWWDGAARRSAADPINLGNATEAVANATLLKGGTVTGVVTDEQGDPVGGVMVRAYTKDSDYEHSAVTDGQGRYTMPGLDEEDYRLEAVPGSNRLDLVGEWYDNKPTFSAADPVQVLNGATVTANFELEKGASISGTVTDDNGPVAGIGIDVFDLNGNKSLTVWTDLQGKYTSTALKAGDYKVRFMPGYYGGHGLVEQWWNNKGTEAQADIIQLGPKQQKTGIDAKLKAIGNATAPDAPTDVQVTPGDEEVTVTWKAPANNGGLPITRYKVEGTPFGDCETLGDLSCTIQGLDNGFGFSFTVQASNSAGLSPKSAPSASGIPFGKPKPPSGVTATPGVESATVSWTPGNSNGRPTTEFSVTSSPGGKTCTTSATTCTVTGLVAGTAHTFTVKARNEAGLSAESAPSAAITPTSPATPPVQPPVQPPSGGGGTPPGTQPAPTTPLTPPAAPSRLKVSVKKGKARATWATVLGATSYEVRISAAKKKGGWKKSSKATYTSGKLKKGSYTFEVRAIGAGGTGASATKRFKVK